MKDLFVGIDTSNYTTSVACVDSDGEILANIKLPLPVKEGELGLRQQAALFEHTKNLPDAFLRLNEHLANGEIKAVGVSARPRNHEGSYMPCFLAGVAGASAFASAAKAPLYRFSHQCGHIRAALAGAGLLPFDGVFTALHISGGTTEIVLCKRCDNGFECEITGGTADLCAGQAVDRTGVMLGFPFPCGPHLERSALEFSGKLPPMKLSIKDTYFNLSGLENMLQKRYVETADKSEISRMCLDFIARSLHKAIENQLAKYGDMPVICSGGVMSNSIIKEKLSDISGIAFAPPVLSADNAVGIAYLTKEKYLENF
ncbi:MAG: peptidase M22 [Clostridia bacterium]|nr:peptidase M22 [Clostridia bacterium]MBQ1933947.1 peptidase M22 [Clostridia bacterium]